MKGNGYRLEIGLKLPINQIYSARAYGHAVEVVRRIRRCPWVGCAEEVIVVDSNLGEVK